MNKQLLAWLLLPLFLGEVPAALAMHAPVNRIPSRGRNPAQARKAAHPLEPLTEAEIRRVLALLAASGKTGPDTLFPYLMLKEPPKKEVLVWKTGAPFRREAFAEIYDRKTGKLFEATVDLQASQVTDFHEVPGMHPSVMLSEFDAVPPIVKADTRFREAMNRRGITNLDEVAIDTWSYGSPRSELSQQARLMRAIAYLKSKGTNFYARPIEGFTAVVDMTEKKVVEVIDTVAYPLPPQSADLDEASLQAIAGKKTRPPLRPLLIQQPKGASFRVRGNEVEWQNWSFRFVMHPREGLVLYMVRYNDHGTWRPVLYRASLSDMIGALWA